MAFFLQTNVSVMEWPACSPNLNPVENVWETLTWQAYHNVKQYLTFMKLKEVIIEAWNVFRKEYLEQLMASMKSRRVELIEKIGYSTSY